MILASLCNYKPGLESGLMLIEEDLSGYRYVKPGPMPICGITGIAIDEKWIYAATQSMVIAVLARKDLSLASFFIYHQIKDPHSMLLEDGRLLVVSSGMNAIYECPIKDGVVLGEKVFWKHRDEEFGSDISHFNSILRYKGRLLVSGFGKKDEMWTSARDGFVMDVESREVVCGGFQHPHTLLEHGEDLLICGSAQGVVRDVKGGRKVVLDGYTRGLCLGSKGLYATVSTGRTISKSTGKENLGGSGKDWVSGIYLLDPVSLEVRKRLEIPDREFYDLMMVGDESKSWSYS